MQDEDFIKRLVFSKRIKKLGLSMVDMVITVQEELIRTLNFKGKYMVLPCGVDLRLFRPMGKDWCRQKLNLPLGKKIVFFPAAPADKQKGFDILNEALSLLGRENTELLVGGNINHEDMPYYMCAADAIVQLSLWEASPMVLKEAMAVNVPVVFTDVGDARSTIQNTKGCFLCKRTPQDVALKLKDAFRCNGSAEGRQRIIEAGLSLSDVAKRIIRVYGEVLGRN
jgi:glycosyltransferase involved in cell wall biosynthesis